MGLFDSLVAKAQLGASELRGAYLDHKREIERKANLKRQQAKSKIELARIKAVEVKEIADLESAMYEAQIAAQNAKKRAKALRLQSGNLTAGERVGRFAKEAYGVGASFCRGLQAPDRKPRKGSR